MTLDGFGLTLPLNSAVVSDKDASNANLDAILSRLPPVRSTGLFFSVLALMAANGLVLYYLIEGRMTPADLVALVALEALVLSAVSRLQLLAVPRIARPPTASDDQHPVGTLIFGLVWLAVVYFLVFWMYFESGDDLLAALTEPLEFFTQRQILWPFLITLAGALLDVVGDHLHHRRLGGYLVSTPGFQAVARWLTLFLGAIPFVVPLLVLGMGLATLVKQWEQRRKRTAASDNLSVFAVIVAVVAAMVLILSITIVGLFRLGLAGWAIGYVSAKLVSEVLVLIIPFIVARIRAEGELGCEIICANHGSRS